MSELDEILEIVDENNKVIRKATRLECYKKGLLHRAVNIFLFNAKGEILLQKRAAKKRFPNFWDLSCSEHVRVGESFEEAAYRGLKEELGIEIEKIEQILPIHKIETRDEEGEIRYLDAELMVTFKAVFDGNMKLDPKEVSEGKFFNTNYLPKPLTPWFLEDWKLLQERIFKLI